LVNNLSAKGSRNLPRLVINFNFLAKYPSRKSVIEARINMISENRYTAGIGRLLNTKFGITSNGYNKTITMRKTMMMRPVVNLFGKFIVVLSIN
jgi:hypothetical protein